MRKHLILFAVFTVVFAAGCNKSDFSPEHVLWYDEPAQMWEETLPLGNGRLGMMPDGGIGCERIVLNEISMWSGSEADYANKDAAESLPEIRELLIKGKNAEAQEVMYERFVPDKPEDGGTYGGYQTLGNLFIKAVFPENGTAAVSDYSRGLDLKSGTGWTKFEAEGVRYWRRYYVSREADVMVVELGNDSGKKPEFEVEIEREGAKVERLNNGLLKMSGRLESGAEEPGVGYAAYVKTIVQGSKAWILISAATSYFEGEDYDSQALAILEKAAKDFDGDRIYKEAVKAHKELYDRAGIHLASEAESAFLPTNDRLQAYAEGAKDNALACLYYNYGRYLLLSSTREGSLPPNLQGLWANTYQTPWNGDYHTNINVQMNHWIAEQGNLSELHLPLTELVLKLIPSGEKTAKAFYGEEAEGWVQHMMTNVWNFTAPGEHPSWGATNTGGAWLCAHLWEHYQYTEDTEYLKKVYPALEGAARFFLTTMMTDPNTGYLVTGPTSSPENTFWCDGQAVSICMGPTMDNQLVRELFTNTLAAAEILNDPSMDHKFLKEIELALDKLAPHRISDGGYLMEWLEDYKEVDIHHRHVSHLYGLHPSNQISPRKTPELAEACRVTLNRRGDEATGWSRAWKLNFWARLGDGDRALKLFKSLLHPACENGKASQHISGTYPNLFCSHPPFQIDGNFGGAAGIGEMLLQSHEGFINVLPALPTEWPKGSLHGFKVRGDISVDLSWENGRATKMVLTSAKDKKVTVIYGDNSYELNLKAGKTTNIFTQ